MDGLDRGDAPAVPPPCSPDPGLVAPTDCCAKGGKGKAGEAAVAAALVAAAADDDEGAEEAAEEACNPAMWAVSPSMSLRNCNISCGVRLDNSRRSSSAVKVGRL